MKPHFFIKTGSKDKVRIISIDEVTKSFEKKVKDKIGVDKIDSIGAAILGMMFLLAVTQSALLQEKEK